MFSYFLFGQHNVQMRKTKPKPVDVFSGDMHFPVGHGHLRFLLSVSSQHTFLCLALKTTGFEISVLRSELN